MPHGAPRARSWQRPPWYAVGCEGAYGVRIDAVRLLSESLLVARQWLGCVFPFIRATHLEPPAEPRSEGRHGAVAACESRRAQHRLGLPKRREKGKSQTSPDKKKPRSKQQQHIPDGNVALKLRVLDGQYGVCASGQVYNPKWAMFLSMIDRTIAAGTDALLAPGQPGETAFCV